MPDVVRTDSQRSDASLRPRVSFNRDVHVKRIVSDTGTRVSGSALSGDGAGHLVALPVRRERLGKRSKQELAEEAAKVLKQVDKVDCTSNHTGVFPEKFYSLPVRRKHRIVDSLQSSIDRKTQRRRSEELGATTPSSSIAAPKKPPRTFQSNVNAKDTPTKSSTVRRSVSDASNLKSKAFRPTNDTKHDTFGHAKGKKAQLSPIIELAQREDYFAQQDKENRNTLKAENVERIENVNKSKISSGKNSESVTEKLKEFIDEIDSVLYPDNKVAPKTNSLPKKPPEVVVIDVDKAEKISTKKDSNKKKFNTTAIGKKLKSITTKKDKTVKKTNVTKSTPNRTNNKGPAPKPPSVNKINKVNNNNNKKVVKQNNASSTSTKIVKETIQTLENQLDRSPKMIHSSQQPPEKLPLTRGRAVDTMVKRLNSDQFSPPPSKTNIIITPNVSVQHNNNQPFSYTRGLSPERIYPSPDGSRSPRYEPGSPVIYAQVVCGNGGPDSNGPIKQTIHTAYTNGKKHLPHSDSDEGLGCEENSGFSRTKYDADKVLMHFGDEMYTEKRNGYNGKHNDDEEFPITPKFKTIEQPFSNGFTSYNNEFSKTEHSIFIDSSSRGRGDGMDSRRRESLTEPHENGFTSPTRLNGNSTTMLNGRSDLSARRDLLESRINSRRIGTGATPVNNKHVTETTSRYYKQGSASPIGYTEKYTSATKTDGRNGERYTTEQRSRTNYAGGESSTKLFDTRYKTNEIRYDNRYDNEPKSFDSQLSDYRSSPENGNARRYEASHDYKTTNKYKSRSEKQQQMVKDRDHHKSNPEIHNGQNGYDYQGGRYQQESYHDSLRRQKHEDSPKRYFDQNENERKDKFGDSGIENDFRRDSGERRHRNRSNREFCNESEDEGFASSLLIASERQHTEDSFNNSRKQRRGDYDSDRGYVVRDDRDDAYRHTETMEYRNRGKDHDVYAHRERSIDDGSHYDPRIDKDLEKERTSTMKSKSTDKKPPKPEKKSSLEKVKQLFTRDSSKKKREKEAARGMVREESLRARYSEYKGSRENLEPRTTRRDATEMQSGYDYTNRRRLSTPSPSPTRQRNGKSEVSQSSSWFKSLDRLSRKKNKKVDKVSNLSNAEEDITVAKTPPTKNLRFFGDTDVESNGSVRRKSALKTRTTPSSARSQSTRDLHNISEECLQKVGRSMQNLNEPPPAPSTTSMKKPPMSPIRRSAEREPVRRDDSKGRTRRRNEVSSVESSTEGDSSQQSQRSVVYLHAATVGDIPGPGYLRNGRRAASREELTSNSSSRIQPQVKTLSRSFSVLAPWKPRHYRESMDIDYTQYPKPNVRNGKYEQKPTKNVIRRKEDAATLKKKAAETRKSNQTASTLNRNSRSKENLSSQTLNRNRTKDDLVKGSSSTLYKKRERFSKENSRYSRGEDKKINSKSMSVESLGGGSRTASRKTREQPREISRSISMPRDPEKTAGWFGLNKKSTKLKSRSTQRL